MRSILTLVFVSSLILCTQAQTWTGNYAVDSTVCDGTQCCCFSSTIILTHPKPSVLRLITEINGPLCHDVGLIIFDMTYPSGFVASLGDSPEGPQITLSLDSRTITIAYPTNAVCQMRALRVSNLPTTTTVATIMEPTSNTEKLAISSMGMLAGILLATIYRVAH